LSQGAPCACSPRSAAIHRAICSSSSNSMHSGHILRAGGTTGLNGSPRWACSMPHAVATVLRGPASLRLSTTPHTRHHAHPWEPHRRNGPEGATVQGVANQPRLLQPAVFCEQRGLQAALQHSHQLRARGAARSPPIARSTKPARTNKRAHERIAWMCDPPTERTTECPDARPGERSPRRARRRTSSTVASISPSMMPLVRCTWCSRNCSCASWTAREPDSGSKTGGSRGSCQHGPCRQRGTVTARRDPGGIRSDRRQGLLPAASLHRCSSAQPADTQTLRVAARQQHGACWQGRQRRGRPDRPPQQQRGAAVNTEHIDAAPCGRVVLPA
jgi:hypothetical protein